MSATIKGQGFSEDIVVLRNVFEEALVNSSVTLFGLQHVYFNPASHYSPSSVCVTVTVTVESITNPDNAYCNDQYHKAAFECYSYDPEVNTTCTMWQFKSSYELTLIDNGRDPTELSNLITTSTITGMLYTLDSSFYKVLSTSSEISFPQTYDTQNYEDYTTAIIDIQINRSLEQMPCRDDATDALKMVLVWVSGHIIHNEPNYNCAAPLFLY